VLNGEAWISYEFKGDGSQNTTGHFTDLDSVNRFDLLFNQAGVVTDRPSSGFQETDLLKGARNAIGSHGDDIGESALIGEELDGANIYSQILGLGGDDTIR